MSWNVFEPLPCVAFHWLVNKLEWGGRGPVPGVPVCVQNSTVGSQQQWAAWEEGTWGSSLPLVKVIVGRDASKRAGDWWVSPSPASALLMLPSHLCWEKPQVHGRGTMPQVLAASCTGSWERAEGHKLILLGNSSRGTRVQALELLQTCCLELGTVCGDVESISQAACSPFLRYIHSCVPESTSICFWPRKGPEFLGMWVPSKVTSPFVFGFTEPAQSWFGSWGLEKHTTKRTSLYWWEAGLMPYYCNCQIHQSLQAVSKTSSSFSLCSGRIASLFWQCSQKSAWDLFILDYVSGHPCSCLSLKVSSSVVVQFGVFVWLVGLFFFYFFLNSSHILPQLCFQKGLYLLVV